MSSLADSPIVVLGVNHSGTRVLVEMLSALGSDAGDCANEWRESETFLEAHRMLLQAQQPGMWHKSRVFNTSYLKLLRPSEQDADEIITMLRRRVPAEFQFRNQRPWHWKCPTSAFFLDFWKRVYPSAYYVQLYRDPLDVARSLIARRQFYRVGSAVRFCDEVNELIQSAQLPRFLRLSYSTLSDSIEELVRFVPGLNEAALPAARKLIREPRLGWKGDRSFQANVWNYLTHGRIAVAKAIRP